MIWPSGIPLLTHCKRFSKLSVWITQIGALIRIQKFRSTCAASCIAPAISQVSKFFSRRTSTIQAAFGCRKASGWILIFDLSNGTGDVKMHLKQMPFRRLSLNFSHATSWDLVSRVASSTDSLEKYCLLAHIGGTPELKIELIILYAFLSLLNDWIIASSSAANVVLPVWGQGRPLCWQICLECFQIIARDFVAGTSSMQWKLWYSPSSVGGSEMATRGGCKWVLILGMCWLRWRVRFH